MALTGYKKECGKPRNLKGEKFMQEKTNGMSLDGFCTCVKYDVRKKMGMDYEVFIQNVTKNNDNELKGLIIKAPNTNVLPTVYLDSYYSRYAAGEDYDVLLEEIIAVYEKHKVRGMKDVSFFMDWKKARERIVFKLVNFEGNRELLKDVPHVRFLDLAIVFNYYFKVPCEGFATIQIHNQHLDMWKVSMEELCDVAMVNTTELMPYKIEETISMMVEMILNGEMEQEEDCSPMYILTNENEINGAGVILYPDILEAVAQVTGCDLYILPRSVHETFLMPVEFDSMSDSHREMVEKSLNEMVRDNNETELTSEEILSDHIYKYTRATGKITM